MAKSSWSYTAKKSDGTPFNGRVMAETFEEASTIIARMALFDPVIVPTNSVAGGEVPQHLVQSAKPALGITGAQGHPNMAFAPLPPMSASEQAQEKDMVARLRHLAEHEDIEEQVINGDKMRQTLVLGLEGPVMARVNPLLDQGGKIVKIKMCSNHHGQIVYAIVVEHRQGQKQEAKP